MPFIQALAVFQSVAESPFPVSKCSAGRDCLDMVMLTLSEQPTNTLVKDACNHVQAFIRAELKCNLESLLKSVEVPIKTIANMIPKDWVKPLDVDTTKLWVDEESVSKLQEIVDFNGRSDIIEALQSVGSVEKTWNTSVSVMNIDLKEFGETLDLNSSWTWDIYQQGRLFITTRSALAIALMQKKDSAIKMLSDVKKKKLNMHPKVLHRLKEIAEVARGRPTQSSQSSPP